MNRLSGLTGVLTGAVAGDTSSGSGLFMTTRIPTGGFRREPADIFGPRLGVDRVERREAAPALEEGDRMPEQPAQRGDRAQPGSAQLGARHQRVPVGRSGAGHCCGAGPGLPDRADVLGNLRHDRDQTQLATQLRSELANAIAPVGPLDEATKPWASGAPVALLEIPRLGLREVVVEGTTDQRRPIQTRPAALTGPAPRRRPAGRRQLGAAQRGRAGDSPGRSGRRHGVGPLPNRSMAGLGERPAGAGRARPHRNRPDRSPAAEPAVNTRNRGALRPCPRHGDHDQARRPADRADDRAARARGSSERKMVRILSTCPALILRIRGCSSTSSACRCRAPNFVRAFGTAVQGGQICSNPAVLRQFGLVERTDCRSTTIQTPPN